MKILKLISKLLFIIFIFGFFSFCFVKKVNANTTVNLHLVILPAPADQNVQIPKNLSELGETNLVSLPAKPAELNNSSNFALNNKKAETPDTNQYSNFLPYQSENSNFNNLSQQISILGSSP